MIRDVIDDVDLIGTMTVKHLMDHYQGHQGVLCGEDCRHFGRPIPPDDDPEDPPHPEGRDPGGGDPGGRGPGGRGPGGRDPGGKDSGGSDPGGKDSGGRGGEHGETGDDESGQRTGGRGGGAGVRSGGGDGHPVRPGNHDDPERIGDASSDLSRKAVDPADPWGVQARRKRKRDSGMEGGAAFPFGSDGPPPF